MRLHWVWVAAQFAGIALLILVGLAWTRLPDKRVWQVALSLLLPLLLAIVALALQAGTLRSLAEDDGKRVRLVFGAVTLLVWVAALWVCWAVLDWYDGQIPLWAGFLNSQVSAHARATLFTYDHIQFGLTLAEWLLRWVVVPAMVIPFAAASAQWGLRLPWRSVLQLLRNWRWWAGVVVAALVGVLLPSHFFNATPSGTVHAQVWHIGLKLAAAYLLAVGSWVLLLGWLAVLYDGITQTERSREAELFCRNLRAGWRLVAGAVGAILLVNLPVWPLTTAGDSNAVDQLAIGIRITAFAAVLVLLILYFRAMFPEPEKRTKLYWGILACIVWFGVTFGVASLDDKFPLPLLHWKWGDFVMFLIFPPFFASAAVWGWLLPWKRIGKLFLDPRWLAAGFATFFAETYFASQIAELFSYLSPVNGSPSQLHDFLAMTLSLGFVVLELAWLAALLTPLAAPEPPKEQPVGVAVGPDDPQRSSNIKLDLP